MNKAICFRPCVPLRKNPSETAEMLTEILYGETCQVMDESGSWVKMHNEADGYEGWATKKMLSPIQEELFADYDPAKQPVVSSACSLANDKHGGHMLLTGGSLLPFYNPKDHTFRTEFGWMSINPNDVSHPCKDAADTARRFLHTPYLWGGKSCMGIDCSGLVQVVFRIHGTQLPRDAKDQIGCGIPIEKLDLCQNGDLAFFSNEAGNVTHVGILIDKNTIIHSSGWVHIDTIDKRGIYDERLGKYTHTLHALRRIVPH